MAVDPNLLATAQAHHLRGQFDEALRAAGAILAANPKHVDALVLRAMVYADQARFAEAEAEINVALSVDPAHSPTHDARGVLLARQERIPEAIECFQRAIALEPTNLAPRFNLATARFQTGDLDAVIQTLQDVLRLDPSSQRAHAGLVLAFASRQRLADAVPHLRELARQNPSDAKTHFELGGALHEAGRLDEAEAAYRKALALDPKYAACCTALASMALNSGKYAEAVELSERACKLSPDWFDANFSLGMARLKQEEYELAEKSLREATRLKPDSAEAFVNLGIALANLTRYDEAIVAIHRALEINTVNAEALHNLGLVHLQLRQLDEARRVIDESLAIEPDNAEGHYNRSTVLFFQGDLAEAFKEYEWRFKTRQAGRVPLRWPRWDGSSVAGRTIVLCGEQGHGDLMQFVRFAQPLAEKGAKVLVECMPRLHPLVSRARGVAGCISPHDPAPPADFCIHLMSVPHLLGSTLETLPREVPYLSADPALVELWRDELGRIGEFRVGIVWQGNPSIGGDRNRSIPLLNFAPLSRVPGVRLIGLQFGPGHEQLAAVKDAWNVYEPARMVDKETGAFMDTAAIMKNLDLVISSDTSAAHLAGALGVPIWLALEYVPDWRWMLEGEESPWYPTMRILRQKVRGQWPDVFERMAEELAPLAAGRGR